MWPQGLTSSQSLLWGVGRRPQCQSSLAWDSQLVWVSDDSEDAAPSPPNICPRCCPFNSPPPRRGPRRLQEDGWRVFPQ